MTLKDCRKALVAFLGTAIAAYVAAWAQTNGVLPGWPTVGMAVGLGIPAALTVFGVRNGDKPIPKVAAHLAPDPPPAVKAAMRAAARQGPQ